MIIDCEFKNVDWKDEVKNKYIRLYTCVVTSASIVKSETKIKVFDGVHRYGKANEDVEAIWMYGTNIEYFPIGLSDIFPNLFALSIQNCGLKFITGEDLNGLEQLQTLNVDKNCLESLPCDLFLKMKNLKKINFTKNNLEFFSSQVLRPIMKSLIYASFQMNKTINAIYCRRLNTSVASFEELMKMIDVKCSKPVEEEDYPLSVDVLRVFKELWISHGLSDFCIKVGLKEFSVHKVVFMMHSSVLSKKIAYDMEFKELIIEHLDPIVVEDFLRYLYTGQLSMNCNALDVYAIAAKLNIPILKIICEKRIMKTIDQLNAYKIFAFAYVHGLEVLKKAASEELKKMCSAKSLKQFNLNKQMEEFLRAKVKFDSMLPMLKNVSSQ